MSSHYRPYFERERGDRERDPESSWDRRREQRRSYAYAEDDDPRGERDFRDRDPRDRDFGGRDLFDEDRRQRGFARGRFEELEEWERPRELGSSSFGRLRPAGSPSASGRFGPFGRYAGRGPKGYQRSDERIKEEVCERLTDDGEVDASEIEVTVENGEVTLAGAVDDRHMKRAAEDCVERVSGVRDVNNRIRVTGARAATRREAAPIREDGDEERDNTSGVSRFWRGGH